MLSIMFHFSQFEVQHLKKILNNAQKTYRMCKGSKFLFIFAENKTVNKG